MRFTVALFPVTATGAKNRCLHHAHASIYHGLHWPTAMIARRQQDQQGRGKLEVAMTIEMQTEHRATKQERIY